MNPLNMELVNQFIDQEVVEFHTARLNKINTLTLSKLTNKNPYLFRAKDFENAADLISDMMAAFISSSDEKFFGDFLENLAYYVARMTYGATKPGTRGVDLQYEEGGIVYVVSIKSGPNWGNSSQHAQLATDLRTASNVIRQSRLTPNVETILGICYGKTKTVRHREGYLKVVGQSFWNMLTGQQDFYKHIMARVGHTADQFSEAYATARAMKRTQLVGTFTNKYCDENGVIDWARLIEVNSKNM